jgi:IclR family pca regulon transcriptional regulator
LLGYLDDAELSARLRSTRFGQYTAKTITTSTALRAELKKVHDQGYAIIDQELEMGLRTIAVPIINSAGHAIAATSVGLNTARATISDMKRLILPVLKEAAEELALLVG